MNIHLDYIGLEPSSVLSKVITEVCHYTAVISLLLVISLFMLRAGRERKTRLK